MILLPPADHRFTPHRKGLILRALRRGELTRPDAIATYGLSEDELESWERRFKDHGEPGLKIKNLQVLGK